MLSPRRRGGVPNLSEAQLAGLAPSPPTRGYSDQHLWRPADRRVLSIEALFRSKTLAFPGRVAVGAVRCTAPTISGLGLLGLGLGVDAGLLALLPR